MQTTTERGRVRPTTRHRLRPATLVAVAAGGALGTAARDGLATRFPVSAGVFPWTTFAINVSGSFVLGALLTFVLDRWPPTRYVRPFVAIGVLGGYTTFSTFSVEADLLFRDGHVAVGLMYVLGSLAAGVAAVYLGIVAGRSGPALRRSTR
jgi:CrcB protein